MTSHLSAYARERVPLAVFAPAILLLTFAALWVGYLDYPPALSTFAALMLMTSLVLQFRLWDDLEDRDADRVTHPTRVLVASGVAPFALALLMLVVITAAIGLATGGVRTLLTIAILDTGAVLLYRLARPRVPAAAWPLLLVAAKYAALVALVATAVGTPALDRLLMGCLTVAVGACLFEMTPAVGSGLELAYSPPHQAASTPIQDLTPETVLCYVCGSADAAPFLEAEDDLTGKPGRFTFVRCNACGLAYQSPRLTIAGIKPYYEDNYIAHQPRARWGALGPLVTWAMGSVDRAKLRIVQRYAEITPTSSVLDVGCGTGAFLSLVRRETGAAVVGVDFVDLSARETLRGVEFHHGVFYEQEVGDARFDLITMWHFLEHDYDPVRSLEYARRALAPGGRIVIEVPRLDSLSFRMFGKRWPGVQAPQHTALYDKTSLLAIVERAGLEVVTHLPYGAFPPYFYLFCGTAFVARRGRGLNLQRAVLPYFAGQILCAPALPLLKRMNFAMQTVICR